VDRRDGDEIIFRPVTLERLVDSPLIAGAYYRTISLGETNNLSHQIHMVADEESQLEMPAELEGKLRRLISETGALFGARHYGQYHFLLTLSDHVAHFGLEHHESSDNRVAADSLGSAGGRDGIAGLLAHEFVHSWNGKFRRPAGLAKTDFSQPYDTDLLWVYEGLTEYLGTILTVRSGLWSPETLRDDLASTAAFLDNRPGRAWRPLADTAVAAQVLYGAPRAGDSWRRSASDFYMESTLIWLEADTIIRERSQGRYSLDDFCRRFHGGSSGSPAVSPYNYTDVVTTLADPMTGRHFSASVWKQWLRTLRWEASKPEAGGSRIVIRPAGPTGALQGVVMCTTRWE
jgi:predicted metalloprotease with PDZ domain